MKATATWIFWIIVIVAGWRWLGPSIRDMDDRLFCDYKNSTGDCLTQAEYIKMVAHDAATDAITDFVASCSGAFSSADPRCALFKHD